MQPPKDQPKSQVKTQEDSKIPDLNMNGKDFWLIKNRWRGSKVYADMWSDLYLRTGCQSDIEAEANTTKGLYEAGFPVLEIVGVGQLPTGEYFFLERSIGRRIFASIFIRETKEHGFVTDKSFDLFTDTVINYCQAQFNPKNHKVEKENAIESVVSLPTLLKYNPPTQENMVLLQEAYSKALDKLSISGLSWVTTLPDLNPFNILPEGMIDFEKVALRN